MKPTWLICRTWQNMDVMQDLVSYDAKSISDKPEARYSKKQIQYYVDLAKRELEVSTKIV